MGSNLQTEAGLMTAAELLALGEGRRELVRGEVIEMTPAGWEHGEIAMEIGAILRNFVKQPDLGRVSAAETGFLLETDPDTVRAPDVAFVRKERCKPTTGYFPGAPDLAVEVISPSDHYSEVVAKVQSWLAHGSLEVWVADPSRRAVQVYRPDGQVITLSGEEVIEGGEILPGFRLPVGECFPGAGA